MGLHFQCAWKMINVETQISSAISIAFCDFPDAASVANELLHWSKKFFNDLSNFIPQDFCF